MLVVFDNDSKLIKAINKLALYAAVAKTQDNDDYEAAVSDTHWDRALGRQRPEEKESEDESESFALETVLHRRMRCMAHISTAKNVHSTLVTKARYMVSRPRKAGMAMQQLQVRENCIQLHYAKHWKFWMALDDGGVSVYWFH